MQETSYGQVVGVVRRGQSRDANDPSLIDQLGKHGPAQTDTLPAAAYFDGELCDWFVVETVELRNGDEVVGRVEGAEREVVDVVDATQLPDDRRDGWRRAKKAQSEIDGIGAGQGCPQDRLVACSEPSYRHLTTITEPHAL
jgi:hypothetical protein